MMEVWTKHSYPHCSVALSCVFVDLMQIEDKFHCLESIIIGEVSAYEESVNKRKSNFHFQKCLCPLTRKCPLTGMCKYRV